MPPAGLRGAFCMLRGARHVVLGEGDVALGVQRDVAGEASLIFEQRSGQKRAPRRIGVERCRVGGATRRGRRCKPDF